MLKKRKITVSGILSVLLIAASMQVTFANVYTDQYIHGKRYRVVAEGISDNGRLPYVTVTVDRIRKADGSSSSYSTILTDIIESSGDQISENANYAIKLKTASNIPLYQSFSEDTWMKLRMKGNEPTLDCIVDFTASLTP